MYIKEINDSLLIQIFKLNNHRVCTFVAVFRCYFSLLDEDVTIIVYRICSRFIVCEYKTETAAVFVNVIKFQNFDFWKFIKIFGFVHYLFFAWKMYSATVATVVDFPVYC